MRNVNECRTALVKNIIKESFYGKKKAINVLIAFFISHKSDIKTFLKPDNKENSPSPKTHLSKT